MLLLLNYSNWIFTVLFAVLKAGNLRDRLSQSSVRVFESLGELPLKLSMLPNKGQKDLFKFPAKSSSVITAVPLKKPLPPLAHSMLVWAHSVDMLNPITPTDKAVTNALHVKCAVFVMEGIVAVFQWHLSKSESQLLSPEALMKPQKQIRTLWSPSDSLNELPSWLEWHMVIKSLDYDEWPLVQELICRAGCEPWRPDASFPSDGLNTRPVSCQRNSYLTSGCPYNLFLKGNY